MYRGLANERGNIILKQAYKVEKELISIIKDFCITTNASLEKKILHIHRIKQMNHNQRWKLLKKLKAA